jgi:hypothetical protein
MSTEAIEKLGRNQEEMNKIVYDLESASWGLPITFRVVPFDTPMICVYIRDEDAGTLAWTTNTLKDDTATWTWWSISTVTMKIKEHGNNVRAALAYLCNEYIDRRIGLIDND